MRPPPPPEYERLSALAAKALAADEPCAVPIQVGDRVTAIAAIERALRSRARRRMLWPAAGAVAAMAAVALVALAVRWPTPPGAPIPATAAPLTVGDVEGAGTSIELAGTIRQAMVRDRVAPGARVRVPGRGSLVLSLASGTRLDLRAASVARVVELGAVQRFDLEEGALLANVARIAPGGRFVIATHDAEIEVKGTRFEVTVDGDSSPCEPRARTRVAVHEGVVAVRHGGREVLLGVNAVWPDCRVSPPAPSPIAEPRPAADRAPKRVTAGSRRRAAHAIAGPRAEAQAPVTASAQTAAPAPVLVSQPASSSAASVSASTLAEQNDLFAAALAAGRRGDVAEALRWLDHLIRRHPQGQLAERAHAERRRLIVSGKRE